jgi:hypothetical protein
MVAIAASTAGLRAMANENVAPVLVTAAMTLPAQYAESPRTRIVVGSAPQAMAVLMPSVSMDAAPLPEPARPARNRTPASTGAAVSVQIVTASGDRPRRGTVLPAIFVCPNEAPCLGVPVHRAQQ